MDVYNKVLLGALRSKLNLHTNRQILGYISVSKKLTANEKSYGKLEALAGQDIVVRLKRKRLDSYFLDGFVVGVSEALLLLHILDDNTMTLNGYSAIRMRDITEWFVHDGFVTRALRLLERTPIVPSDAPLTDWAALIAWAQPQYPLVQIEAEKKFPGCAYIGRVKTETKHGVLLHELNGDALWDQRLTKHAYASITQVQFASGYIETLMAVSDHEKSS